MATLTSYEGSDDDYENSGTAQTKAQSFKISVNGDVTGFSFSGSQGGLASGTFKWELLDAIEGSVLATTGTLNTSTLAAYESPGWNDINFASSATLDADTTYFLKLTAVSGSTTDEIRWNTDTTSPTYADGSIWYGTTADTGRDGNFRIYGTEITDITVSAPLLEITTTLNIPTLELVSAIEVAPPTLSVTTTLPVPTLSMLDLWTNNSKNTSTFTNASKESTTWTNADKS